jgi:hypothetical protein
MNPMQNDAQDGIMRKTVLFLCILFHFRAHRATLRYYPLKHSNNLTRMLTYRTINLPPHRSTRTIHRRSRQILDPGSIPTGAILPSRCFAEP